MRRLLTVILGIVLGAGLTACDIQSGKNGGEINVCIIEAGIGTEWLGVVADSYYQETGVKVNYYSDPGLDGALKQTMLLGTAEDDLYLAPNTYDWIQWAASDKLADLSDISEQKYSDGSSIDSKIKSNISELGVVNGKRYIIQFTYNPTGIVYNSNILKQVGYDAFPTTWDGLIQLCSDVNAANLTNRGKKIKPLVWGTNDLFDMYKTLWAQGDYDKFQSYFAQEGSAPQEELFLSAERLKALEAIYDLLAPNANYSTTTVEGMQGETNLICQETFIQGYAAMCFSGSWFETEMISIIDDTTFEYKFAPYPALPGNEIVVNINYPTEYLMIPSYAKNAEQAKEFLKYMLDEANLVKMHNEMQSPLAFDYDTTLVDFTRWGSECQNIIDSQYHKIIAGANTMRYLSGGIRPEFASRNPFLLICNGDGTNRTGIRRELLNTLLSENYAKFQENWQSGYLKAKGIQELLESK